MRQLTKTQTATMAVGATLMVIGLFTVLFGIGNSETETLRKAAAIMFATGTVIFAVMQMMQTYSGQNITLMRLRKIMVIGNVCLILSGLLMLEHTFRIAYPLFATSIQGYNNYYHYIHNNWGVFLLIAGVLELYTTLRISHELSKDI